MYSSEETRGGPFFVIVPGAARNPVIPPHADHSPLFPLHTPNTQAQPQHTTVRRTPLAWVTYLRTNASPVRTTCMDTRLNRQRVRHPPTAPLPDVTASCLVTSRRLVGLQVYASARWCFVCTARGRRCAAGSRGSAIERFRSMNVRTLFLTAFQFHAQYSRRLTLAIIEPLQATMLAVWTMSGTAGTPVEKISLCSPGYTTLLPANGEH